LTGCRATVASYALRSLAASPCRCGWNPVGARSHRAEPAAARRRRRNPPSLPGSMARTMGRRAAACISWGSVVSRVKIIEITPSSFNPFVFIPMPSRMQCQNLWMQPFTVLIATICAGSWEFTSPFECQRLWTFAASQVIRYTSLCLYLKRWGFFFLNSCLIRLDEYQYWMGLHDLFPNIYESATQILIPTIWKHKMMCVSQTNNFGDQ